MKSDVYLYEFYGGPMDGKQILWHDRGVTYFSVPARLGFSMHWGMDVYLINREKLQFQYLRRDESVWA